MTDSTYRVAIWALLLAFAANTYYLLTLAIQAAYRAL